MAMKRRILVVEDEESAREGLLEALSPDPAVGDP